jgi:hypothetical protein
MTGYRGFDDVSALQHTLTLQHRPGKLLIYGARHIARIDRQRLGFLETVIFSVTFCLKFLLKVFA